MSVGERKRKLTYEVQLNQNKSNGLDIMPGPPSLQNVFSTSSPPYIKIKSRLPKLLVIYDTDIILD